MPLSWNEIRDRATSFSREWKHAENEDAEAKSFWDDFFEVFGVPRRRVAFLFERYQAITSLLPAADKLARKRSTRARANPDPAPDPG